jgi:hypothetical protein
MTSNAPDHISAALSSISLRPSSPSGELLGFTVTQPIQPVRDISDIRKSMEEFIQIIDPEIRRFLAHPSPPTWHPKGSVDTEIQEFYKNMGIPQINGKPSLLIHNLGKSSNRHIDQLLAIQENRQGLLFKLFSDTNVPQDTVQYRWLRQN